MLNSTPILFFNLSPDVLFPQDIVPCVVCSIYTSVYFLHFCLKPCTVQWGLLIVAFVIGISPYRQRQKSLKNI